MQLTYATAERNTVRVVLLAGETIGNMDGPATFDVPVNAEGNAEWEAIKNSSIGSYVPPAATPQQIRDQSFTSDAERIDILSRLQSATPAQIRSYMTANVTDLASARSMLTKILLVLSLLASP